MSTPGYFLVDLASNYMAFRSERTEAQARLPGPPAPNRVDRGHAWAVLVAAGRVAE